MLQRPMHSTHIATTDESGDRRLREQAVPKARGFSLHRRTVGRSGRVLRSRGRPDIVYANTGQSCPAQRAA